jgi:hypothetical protein
MNATYSTGVTATRPVTGAPHTGPGTRPRRRRARSPLRAAAALLTLVGGVLTLNTAVPQAAHASSSCWSGPTVTTYLGHRDAMRTCPTWTGTNVYLDTLGASHTWVVGYLYAADNWVYCQKWGAANPRFGTSSYNHYWLYTQGDVNKATAYDTDAWGWVPATAVSYGGNDGKVPGVPTCPEGFYGN